MDREGTKGGLPLIEYVMALENKTSRARGIEVQAALEAMGINAEIQERRFPRTTNLVVDFTRDPSERRLLFSAHYDVIKNRPGANDNASSVAVLLGLCQQLKNVRAPVRVVFFDREEAWLRTPFVKLGLLGSLYYVFRNDLHNIEAVYNLEFCGQGDSLSIWPVKGKKRNVLAVKIAEKAAATLKMEVRLAHVPWLLLSSDHLSFRLRGVSNSITLSLLPSDQLPVLEQFVSNLHVLKLLFGHRPTMPGVLFRVHKDSDVSSRLSEDSLKLMLSLIVGIIQSYDF